MKYKYLTTSCLLIFGLNAFSNAQNVYQTGNVQTSSNQNFEQNISQIRENGINPVGGVYIQQPNVNIERNSQINSILKQTKEVQSDGNGSANPYQIPPKKDESSDSDIKQINNSISKQMKIDATLNKISVSQEYRSSNITEWNKSTLESIEDKAKINDGIKYQKFITNNR